MSAGTPSSPSPYTGVVGWIDDRLPVFTYLQKEYGEYPSPRNFNYWWNFGAILTFMLVLMIATGIVLAMQYQPHTDMAFDSVERIMRDVNYGWLLALSCTCQWRLILLPRCLCASTCFAGSITAPTKRRGSCCGCWGVVASWC